MQIPIDRYRLLGVAVGADKHIVLNQLERRLDKCKYPGFSVETLQKREQILRESGSVLLDSNKRTEYEAEYVNDKTFTREVSEPQTAISKGQEIAGLLLLLEVGEYEACISMSESLYREQRMNMSYFSSEYKEINRIIDYATLAFAKELRSIRHFETAAEVLEKRISDQTVSMGEKERITQMVVEQKQLLPFRVLDMLSRDNNEEIHRKGVILLKSLVKERGGLDAQSEIYMDNGEFHAFFRQIRSYLTVQEQIDLYEDWANEGSRAAQFLSCIALTAQGFAQRKPDKINEALQKIEIIRADELGPIIANMNLLLGNVESATLGFEKYADKDLKAWATERTEDPLGSVCEWCREWLKRDVIKGYRDIEIDSDLESYFCDKDVIKYIEDKDRRKKKELQNDISSSSRKEWKDFFQEKKEATVMQMNKNGERKIGWQHPRYPGSSALSFLKENGIVVLVIALSSLSLWLFKSLNNEGRGSRIDKEANVTEKRRVVKDTQKETVESVNETLAEWLRVKKETLERNEIPKNATLIATPELLEQLKQEAELNVKKGQSQRIDVQIKKIQIREELPRKLKVNAELKYSDKVIDRSGETLAETKSHTFERRYNFVWNGSKWIIDKI